MDRVANNARQIKFRNMNCVGCDKYFDMGRAIHNHLKICRPLREKDQFERDACLYEYKFRKESNEFRDIVAYIAKGGRPFEDNECFGCETFEDHQNGGCRKVERIAAYEEMMSKYVPRMSAYAVLKLFAENEYPKEEWQINGKIAGQMLFIRNRVEEDRREFTRLLTESPFMEFFFYDDRFTYEEMIDDEIRERKEFINSIEQVEMGRMCKGSSYRFLRGKNLERSLPYGRLRRLLQKLRGTELPPSNTFAKRVEHLTDASQRYLFGNSLLALPYNIPYPCETIARTCVLSARNRAEVQAIIDRAIKDLEKTKPDNYEDDIRYLTNLQNDQPFLDNVARNLYWKSARTMAF